MSKSYKQRIDKIWMVDPLGKQAMALENPLNPRQPDTEIPSLTREDIGGGIALEVISQLGVIPDTGKKNSKQRSLSNSIGHLIFSGLDEFLPAEVVDGTGRATAAIALGLGKGIADEFQKQAKENALGLAWKAGSNFTIGAGMGALAETHPLVATVIGIGGLVKLTGDQFLDPTTRKRNQDLMKIATDAYRSKTDFLIPYYARKTAELTKKEALDCTIGIVAGTAGAAAGSYGAKAFIAHAKASVPEATTVNIKDQVNEVTTIEKTARKALSSPEPQSTERQLIETRPAETRTSQATPAIDLTKVESKSVNLSAATKSAPLSAPSKTQIVDKELAQIKQGLKEAPPTAKIKRSFTLPETKSTVTEFAPSAITPAEPIYVVKQNAGKITRTDWQSWSDQYVNSLSLSGSKFDQNQLIGFISENRQLQSVNLSFTSAGDDALAAFSASPTLKVADLTQTKVGDMGMVHLASCPEITDLNLANTKITDFGLQMLEHHPSIERLDLRGTKITDAALSSLKTLPHLKEVLLTDCQVTVGGIADLAKQSKIAVINYQTPVEPKEYFQIPAPYTEERSIFSVFSDHISDFQVNDKKYFAKNMFVSLSRNLKELTCNKIGDFVVNWNEKDYTNNIKQVPQLESLVLNNNWYQDDCLHSAINCPQMEKITVNCHGSPELTDLPSMKNLKTLILNNVEPGSKSLGVVQLISSLKELTIEYTGNIFKLPLSQLQKLPHLEKLTIIDHGGSPFIQPEDLSELIELHKFPQLKSVEINSTRLDLNNLAGILTPFFERFTLHPQGSRLTID